MNTDIHSVGDDIGNLASRYSDHKKKADIPNIKQPWAFVAVSKNFNKIRKTFTYAIGDVVTSLDAVPEGLNAFEIPAIKYAVFPVRPKNRLGWADAISSMKKYIYDHWLPNSGYAPAGIIDDFEYHDERSTKHQNPEMDLYIAIKVKRV